jgi:hypothetical protein
VNAPARGTKLLIALVSLAVFPAAWFIQPHLSDPVSVCFFRTITGYRCPFCGLTHALAAAMRGRFRTAWHYHPLWWIAPLILLWIAGAAISDALFQTNELRYLRLAKSKASWPWIGAILVVVWVINAMNG